MPSGWLPGWSRTGAPRVLNRRLACVSRVVHHLAEARDPLARTGRERQHGGCREHERASSHSWTQYNGQLRDPSRQSRSCRLALRGIQYNVKLLTGAERAKPMTRQMISLTANDRNLANHSTRRRESDRGLWQHDSVSPRWSRDERCLLPRPCHHSAGSLSASACARKGRRGIHHSKG